MTITRKQKWEETQLHRRFKCNISYENTWTWLRKGNIRREIVLFLIAAQNHPIRTNHIKARINKTQKNSKWMICGNRDGTIDHIISECNKLTQKEYKTRHDWLLRWSTGICARNLNITIWTNGIYKIPNLSYRITCKLPWDFDLQTNYLISARRQKLIIINNKKRELANLWILQLRLTPE